MSIAANEIEEGLLSTRVINSGATNYVGIAIGLLESKYEHSCIFISCNHIKRLAHYPGENKALLEENPKDSYFYKTISFIPEKYVEAFLVHCKQVCESSKPKFGLFYDGSYYDLEGKYFSEKNKKQFMTCVGFCINIIKGFLEKEYFNYEDWTAKGPVPEKYFERFVKEHKITSAKDKAKYRNSMRRIKPSELTASAYLMPLPIRKHKVDEIISAVEMVIEKKLKPRPTSSDETKKT